MSNRQQERKWVLPSKKHGDSDGGSSSRGNLGKKNPGYEDGGCKPQPSHLQEDDGNARMKNVQKDLQVKKTLYTKGCNKEKVKLHNEGSVHIPGKTVRKPLEGKEAKTQVGTMGTWFMVTIPYGRKYYKICLMTSIQNLCSVPFIPVDFHYVKHRARFFVQGASTASALKDVSYKICDEENQKIPIFVITYDVPYSVRDKLAAKEVEQLKLTLRKRYSVSQKALNLHKLRYDPGLMSLDIEIILNRRNCMVATLQIIKNNFPELLSLNLCKNKLKQLDGLSDIIQIAPTLKILNLSRNKLRSVYELNKMNGLKLEELWLCGNPFCSTFPDQSTYISAIRKYFPKLLRLDGHLLPPPIIVDTDRHYFTKPCQGSYKIPKPLKYLVLQFLRMYYLIYDSGDRWGLLDAYHNEACFSLTIPFNPMDPAPMNLFDYFKDNRNMKNLKNPYLRVQLLKHTKRDIVWSLCALPKTQHDLSSFMVEFWVQTETMVCFSVNGVFMEVEGWCQGFMRAFTRNFIAVPASNSSISIVNDELFVMDITPNKTQSTLSIPMHVYICNSLLTLSQEHREMVLAFSTQTGMRLLWSQKCLQENQWNYTRASQVFTMLKPKAIPMTGVEGLADQEAKVT